MRLTRTLTLLATLCGLSACMQQGGSFASGGGAPQPLGVGSTIPGAPPPAGSRVAMLAPLTGSYAGVAQGLVNAAKLGLGASGGTLDVIDTGGTPQGAAQAAQKAIADGAGIIIGPLTAGETGAVAPVAQSGHAYVLALTSDPAQARPGVWTLGITPAQQVHALVAASASDGHSHFAGLLPQTALGNLMGQALQQATAQASLPPPTIQTYGGSFSSMNDATRAIADYSGRRGPLEAQMKALRAQHSASGRAEAAKLSGQGVAPPPFDSLLIAESGSGLGELATLLPYYDISPAQVRVLGPGLWAANPAAVANAGLGGAYYAAPDPAAAAGFSSAYAQAYGGPPSPLAALAYDAGAIARVTTTGGHVDVGTLTNPSGFAGADGFLALQPDGHVKRGLAVFQVGSDGAHIVQPAPQNLNTPNS